MIYKGKAMDAGILRLHNVTKKYQQGVQVIEVLSDISLAFHQGKTYAITGVSGAGKSTLLHILAGLDQPTQGQVLFNAAPLGKQASFFQQQFLAHHVGLIFQQPYLIRELSVLENIVLRGMIAGLDRKECGQQARELLNRVGLDDKADSLVTTLSGGQQQRVALARALMGKPSFLLADEPTGNLDEATGKQMVDLLLACQRETGMGMIISSHDAYVTEKMDQVLVVHNGKVV